MDRILIGYLNDGRRIKHLNYMCKFLSQSTYCHKYTIIILSSEKTTLNICKEIIEKYNIDCVLSTCQSDYMPKIREFVNYALSNKYTHCFKMDNDIILPPHIFDYIYKEIYNLPENIGILLPCLYTSIPSAEYFIQDFLTHEEQSTMYKLFESFRYSGEFKNLNSVYPTKWSLESYFNMVEKMSSPNQGVYKAIHPIRFFKEATIKINEYAIKHRDSFFSPPNTPTLYVPDSPHYFMPQTFIMKTELLKNVFDSGLAYDSYDEVTLNRLIRREGKKIAFIRNCFGIHIAHNGYMTDFMNFEEIVLDRLFE